MTGSGYINASRQKIRSDFESVMEQTGIFAGKQGFAIQVGEHTQLKRRRAGRQCRREQKPALDRHAGLE